MTSTVPNDSLTSKASSNGSATTSQSSPAPGAPQASPALDDDRLRPFLKMHEPKAASIVEFKEPFRVSLDSLYTSLYLNSSFDRPRQTDVTGKPTRSVTLDRRPKRWYREYKAIADATRMAKLDVNRSNAELTQLENGGAYPAGVERAAHDARIRDARRRYFRVRDNLETLRDQGNLLIQEMRAAGYVLRTDNVPASIAELGFDFYLLGGLPGYKDFKPLHVPASVVFGEDSAWTALEKSLRERLFASKRFSTASRARYQTQCAVLADAAAFSPTIQPALAGMDQDLEVIEGQLTQLHKQLSDVDHEIENWTSDRRVLADAQVLFRPYRADEYPTSGGAGPVNNTAFKNWLSETYATLNAFSYKLNVNGQNYSVAIDGLAGFEWYQDYQVSSEVIELTQWIPHGWPDSLVHGPGHNEPAGKETRYHYTISGDPEIRTFFDTATRLCDQYVQQILPGEAEAIKGRLSALETNKAGLKRQRHDLESNGLGKAREDFVEAWNRPDVIDKNLIGDGIVDPNADPLADLLGDLEAEGEIPRLYSLEFRSDGYYTQDGQSLLDFVKGAGKLPHSAVLLLPVFDRSGRRLAEVTNAVVNPLRSGRGLRVPSITFVETYQIEIRWNGYCLGELTQTVNLFPGEKKELTTTQITRLSQELMASQSLESETARTDTCSFEETLGSELSERNQLALQASNEDTTSRKEGTTHLVADDVEHVDTVGISMGVGGSSGTTTNIDGRASADSKVNVGAGGGGGTGKEGTPEAPDAKAELKNHAELGGSKQNTKTETHGITADARSTNTNLHRDEKTDALEISQNQITKAASQESRECFKKTLSNTVHRTASQVSARNKVSVSMSSRITSEQALTRTETIKLENPSLGRTVNYHLFQLQNTYEVTSNLIDVKIVVDPGIEAIKASELSDVRVFNLEEFGRIFWSGDSDDPRAALLATTVARQVFKNYCDFEQTDPGRRVALRMTDVLPFDEGMLKVLSLAAPAQGADASEEGMLIALRDALAYLKGRAFKFQRVEALPKQTETVNTGSFYLEAEVGSEPATERYLEDRRNLEMEKQRVELEEIRARIQAGAFTPRWPSGLTSLTLTDGVSRGAEPATRP